MSHRLGRPGPDRLLFSTRLALLFGFGGLLAIMTISGMNALRGLQRIRADEDRLRSQYFSKAHLLDDIRAEFLSSATYVRDFLLDPNPRGAKANQRGWEEANKKMGVMLDNYRRLLKPEEAAEYSSLLGEMSDYWKSLDGIAGWTPDERRDRGYVFLRDAVYPRRLAMMGVTDHIGEINEGQLNESNHHLSDLLARFQARLGITLLGTLVLGLGMAGFSARKILRLERRANAQYEEVSEAQRQLKELSARLVQTQETERRALSRELHDEVGQALSAVLVELRNLSAGIREYREEETRDHLDVIKGLVENTIRVVRNMALLLRPSMLDDLGLIPALRWQARELSKRTAMNITVSTDVTSDDLPDEYNTCVYRVVQEALHNCSRHSSAKSVQVTVREDQGRLLLSVADDGVGFEAAQSKGLGLLGIEERVARLGGRFHLKSKAGSGTVLHIDLPLPEKDSHDRSSETDSHLVGR